MYKYKGYVIRRLLNDRWRIIRFSVLNGIITNKKGGYIRMNKIIKSRYSKEEFERLRSQAQTKYEETNYYKKQKKDL